jgi:hypothetical protein
MLPLLQPIKAGLVDASSEFTFVHDLVCEVQNDLYKSHRYLASVWLGPDTGEQWYTTFKTAK